MADLLTDAQEEECRKIIGNACVRIGEQFCDYSDEAVLAATVSALVAAAHYTVTELMDQDDDAFLRYVRIWIGRENG